MSVTIPRAEVNAVAAKHNDALSLDTDPPVEYVRHVAAELRADAPNWSPALAAGDIAEADDLDALADRYEKEQEA